MQLQQQSGDGVQSKKIITAHKDQKQQEKRIIQQTATAIRNPPVFACVPLFVCGCARVRVTLFAGEQEKKQSEEEEEARTEQGPPFAHLPPEESRASPESLYCLASDSPTP
jgi:hypothetical protein